MPAEPNLCPNCPLDPYWQKVVFDQLKEKQQQYHQKTSAWGTVKLSRGVEEPSAHKICLARRVKLKELGLECPYFPATEDISRFANVAVEEEPRQLELEEQPELEPEETVNPLQAQVVRRRLRQQSIRQRYL